VDKIIDAVLGIGIVVGIIWLGEWYNNRRLSRMWGHNAGRHCARCGGTGYLPQFKHVQNGICFRCHGAASNGSISLESVEKRDRLSKEALLRQVEEKELRSAYLMERRDYYRTLKEEKLFDIWSGRHESALEEDEIELLRKLLRELKGISSVSAPTIAVCADCGMVGDNCSCRER
jgi:hypothetical protein